MPKYARLHGEYLSDLGQPEVSSVALSKAAFMALLHTAEPGAEVFINKGYRIISQVDDKLHVLQWCDFRGYLKVFEADEFISAYMAHHWQHKPPAKVVPYATS